MEFADEGRKKKCLQSDAVVVVDLAERALRDKRVHVFAKCFRTTYTLLRTTDDQHTFWRYLKFE